MRRRLPAALLLLLSVVAAMLVWLGRSHRQRSTAQPVPHPSDWLVAPLGSGRPATGSRADPWLDQSEAADPGPDGAKPDTVHARPKHRALAAAEETSADPEVAPGLAPATALENMRGALRQYSSRFGGNPVGTNHEITRSLNGGNPGQTVFIAPEDGLRVNEQGELVDTWGTPYFFHQLSAAEMEIHSAGPDRRMWTTDDLVLK